MINSSKDQARFCTAFSSAGEESRRSDAEQVGDAGPSLRRAGANAKPDEITTLERRVLAYERILQALLGHLADDDPAILVQLKARFGNGHNMGEYEQDYVSTDHYGEHFIRTIEAEVAERQRKYDAIETRAER